MRFQVLGPLEVAEANGTRLPIAGSKERTILACLIARAGQVVPVDDLVDELWGDSPPRAPEKTLTSYVSRLRRDLQRGRAAGSSDVIVFRSGGYALQRDGHEIDAVGFEDLASEGHRLLEAGDADEADRLLAEALDLWRGAAYQGYRYTRFGATEGDRLDELRRTAAEDLIESRLGGSDPGRLVPELEAMVRDEPLRERRWAQLMVALYRAGRQGEALQAFARAREVLATELGVEPGVELQRLQAAILAHDPDLDRAAVAPEATLTIDVCPYKGLARFETSDAAFFFGREPVVAEAVGTLVGSRFLALIGPSGSGKSSLLRAGVVHALTAGAIPGSDRWTTYVIRPGEHPLAALGTALEERPGHTLLAIDQFEEVFTACADGDERTAFLDAITSAAAPEGAVTVALAMRADFYGRCAEHRALASSIAAHQILVGPMDADELRRAIELPASHAGLAVEGDLVDALVSDTDGQPGALPLLSTALLELWTHRHDGTLRLEDYLRAGGVDGAVARLAEDAYGRLDAAEQQAAKRILLRLAAPGDGTGVVRRQAALAEFDLERDEAAARAMDVLADARLITVSEGTAEVAHEALLREWPRLRTWLEDDADGRALHRHITEATHTWDEGGRDAADLYRGARQAAAWDWASAHDADLNDMERQFLASSHAASEGEAIRSKRTNRRLRALLAGVALLLVASLVIGDLALTQRDRATAALTVADAGRLASRSRLETDPQLALLMAREAVNISDSPETRSALFAALERSPAIIDRMYGPDGPSQVGDETQWIESSPDGSTLAIGDAGPSVAFFDAAQHRALGSVVVGSGTERAAFSPDGRTLAVVSSGGDLVAIDVAARTVRSRIPVSSAIDAIAFDPGGSTLVTAEHHADLRESLVPRDPVSFAQTGGAVKIEGRDGATFPAISRPLTPFAMAFAADGGALVATRENGPTLLLRPDLTVVRRYPDGGQGVAISPDGSTAALLRNDDFTNVGQVWFLHLGSGDLRKGSGGHTGPYKTQYEAVGAAFTPDGRSLVTVGNDSRLLVWDVATASERTTLAQTGDLPLRGPALSRDGTTAYTTDRSGEVVVWDLSGPHRLDRPFSAGAGFPGWPWFALSSDGRLLATVSSPGKHFNRNGTVNVFDMRTLRVIQRIPYPDGSPQALSFSPDGRTLAVTSVGDGRPSDARLWDVATGTQLMVLHGIARGQRLVSITFSPDGAMVVGGGTATTGGTVTVWEPQISSAPSNQFHTRGTVEEADFRPDGSQLVVSTGWGKGGDFVLWDVAGRRVVGSVRADDSGVWTSTVSADGSTLMTGGQTGAVRLWRLPTGTSLGAPLNGLAGSTVSVGITPDGRTALGADTSGNVVLWDLASRSTIGDPLPGPPTNHFAAAAFTPGGTRLIVVSDTGDGWIWDVDPASWLRRACTVAGRNFTVQEWQQILPDRAYQPTCRA